MAYRSGGAAAVGLVGLLRMVPSAVLAPLLSPLADRGRRERVLVVVSTVRGLATAAAAALVAVDGPVAVVYALAVVSTIAATLFRPAHSALLPSLCHTGHELASANVVRGLLDSAATLIGPRLAAVLLGLSGVEMVFAVSAAASLWSAALVVGLRYDAPPRPDAGRASRLLPEAAEGLRAVASNGGLLLVFGLGAAQALTRGALTVLSVVAAIELLGTGESGVGALMTSVGVGAVLGSLAASLLVSTTHLGRWFALGIGLWGLPLAIVGSVPVEPVALGVLALIGVGNALVDVAGFTLMARMARDEVLARVFGVFESVVALSVGLGSLVASLLVERFDTSTALIVVGLVCPVLATLALSRLGRLDLAVGALDEDVTLLRGVSMLAPLPLPAVEGLARGLRPFEVAAGETVFRQGDTGDEWFVIESGTVDVLGDGQVVTTLGPGEGFGEIALLRDTPRTATVVAREDLHLRALCADHFVPVVLGHPHSTRRAGADVDELLDRFHPHEEE
ncbi:hypothetical protein N803_14895 [Knoellia subterranea KCTC 19937]|uniref:Cyclic nucleotide-binding domain-containing protein n=1 Tax=Knoellia subterranea KCTC 19937 TaxID=1385521 RepID=A0A0A0JKI6_9MICO|nr:hypothetical protein N803_14895 [Knoellia subterranea KCTC 19937]